jgi:small-conductance mechanosensitive channel
MWHSLERSLHVSHTIFDLAAIGAVLGLALLIGLVLNRIFHHWTVKLKGKWGEWLFALLASFPIPLMLLAGIHVSLRLFELPRVWRQLGDKLILAVVIVVIFYFPAKVFILSLRRVSQRDPALERVTAPATFVVRALFALVAIIVILENLGIHLTAVWTTLGVGSVAVALALQDTLSNFFAGLYVLADQPIRLGDFIKLDSGHEGYVTRIGWRSTQLRTLPNSIVVLPNSTLSKAIITNYSLPEPRVALPLKIGVVYGTDVELVERALLEVAEQAIEAGTEGLLSDPRPAVRFIPGFGDSSLDFTLVVHVRSYVDQFFVQHEVRKRIVQRFAKEGIEFAFPTRTLVLDKSALPLLGGPAAQSEPQT